MNTDILIISCAKHFPWLRYALKSCVRFATGFRQVLVLIPKDDLPAMTPLLTELSTAGGIPIRVMTYDDWPGKGFLRHEHVIMCSDEFTDADFILHMDSDCLFVEPVSPADYFVDGKPVLLQATYHWLVNYQQANLGMWKAAVDNALGGNSEREFMRRHPAVHKRDVYGIARQIIKGHTGKDCADYIRSCEEAFPQTFCEFNTLGEVAWGAFRSDYHWLDQEKGEWPHAKVVQFWSHASPEVPQRPVYKDHPFECTPESLLKLI